MRDWFRPLGFSNDASFCNIYWWIMSLMIVDVWLHDLSIFELLLMMRLITGELSNTTDYSCGIYYMQPWLDDETLLFFLVKSCTSSLPFKWKILHFISFSFCSRAYGVLEDCAFPATSPLITVEILSIWLFSRLFRKLIVKV